VYVCIAGVAYEAGCACHGCAWMCVDGRAIVVDVGAETCVTCVYYVVICV